jgi:hypothetical protein
VGIAPVRISPPVGPDVAHPTRRVGQIAAAQNISMRCINRSVATPAISAFLSLLPRARRPCRTDSLITVVVSVINRGVRGCCVYVAERAHRQGFTISVRSQRFIPLSSRTIADTLLTLPSSYAVASCLGGRRQSPDNKMLNLGPRGGIGKCVPHTRVPHALFPSARRPHSLRF